MKFAALVAFALLAMAALATAQTKPVIPQQYSFAAEVFLHDGQKQFNGFAFAFVDHTNHKLAEKALWTVLPNSNQAAEAHTFHMVAHFDTNEGWLVTDGDCEDIDADGETDLFDFMHEAKFAGRRERADGSVVNTWITIDEVTGFITLGSFDARTGTPVEVTLQVPQSRVYSTQMIHTWTVGEPHSDNFDKPSECFQQKQTEIYW